MSISLRPATRTARNFRQGDNKSSRCKMNKRRERRQFSVNTSLDACPNFYYMQRRGEAFTIYVGKRNIPIEVNITRIYCRKRKGRKKVSLILTPFNNACTTPIQARYKPDNNTMKVSAIDHRLWKSKSRKTLH